MGIVVTILDCNNRTSQGVGPPERKALVVLQTTYVHSLQKVRAFSPPSKLLNILIYQKLWNISVIFYEFEHTIIDFNKIYTWG
ncbi:hypothetical protein D9V87_07890 [Bacteroidetes/Chlorobi group bacterium MS-B_bin-24]|nr:MAG: hypothetical protein D9V87_07890 [Bacteroidetes/Chlorobi group bacterium MS-B_bin-24]